jgi:hypothetical protein
VVLVHKREMQTYRYSLMPLWAEVLDYAVMSRRAVHLGVALANSLQAKNSQGAHDELVGIYRPARLLLTVESFELVEQSVNPWLSFSLEIKY